MDIFCAEMIGTFFLVLLGNGVVANVLLHRSKGEGSGWIVISAGWGFAVAISVYLVGWASGAHINPAVTFGFALHGTIPWSLLPIYWSGQMVGGLLGGVFVWLTYYRHWEATENPTLKLLCFCTQPAIRCYLSNFLTETIATAVLLAGILGIFNIHNGIASGVGPYAVGILVFSIGLSLGGATGYAINPARDLGPRIAHALLPIKGKGSSDWRYAWVPVFAPLVGGALGVGCYQLLIYCVQ